MKQPSSFNHRYKPQQTSEKRIQTNEHKLYSIQTNSLWWRRMGGLCFTVKCTTKMWGSL